MPPLKEGTSDHKQLDSVMGRGLEETFLQTMAQEHMERCSTPLLIRKSKPQRDTTSHIRMATIKTPNQLVLARTWTTRKPVHLGLECKAVQLAWKTLEGFAYELNTELPYAPAIPAPGTHPTECKAGSPRAIWSPMFILTLSTRANT